MIMFRGKSLAAFERERLDVIALHVVQVNVFAGGDVLRGRADGHAIFQNFFTGANGAGGELVAEREAQPARSRAGRPRSKCRRLPAFESRRARCRRDRGARVLDRAWIFKIYGIADRRQPDQRL